VPGSLSATAVQQPFQEPGEELVAGRDLAALSESVQARMDGVTFRSGAGEHFHVDPIPRVIEASEWDVLERGLGQRTRALNAFVADAYGERRCVAAGAIPARVIDGAEHHEPALAGQRAPQGVWIGVAGLDLVRDTDGRFLVLEDNAMTPSGFAYAAAARAAVGAELGPGPVPLDPLPSLLGGALDAVRPPGEDGGAVVLTDGPENSAHWEHAWCARALGVPLVEPGDLRSDGVRLWHGAERVAAVYRRTNADRVATPVGELLGGPLRAGTLGVLNGFGTGVADDKLSHAYVETMIRFYLGEEPVLGSVPTFDLGLPAALEEVLDRLGELVVKPRDGHGGQGVVLGPYASREQLDALRGELTADPERFVAQPLVTLSRHPTVVDGTLQARHVDLRPFVFLHGPGDARVLAGGLTRVALDAGAMVVNSSQNGGAKDTWVLQSGARPR
jgi:uncharacterized circularly permuted ATP-grasp superfamily protein